MSIETGDHPRRVRSFVRRPGRLTPAQARALEELLPIYQVAPSLQDLRQAFERSAPLVLEIGFGNGAALVSMAANEAEFNFVGVEVHEPGVGRALRAVQDQGLPNVRVAMRDAVELLATQVPPASLEQVRIYFPDPWPKKRHHKRRIIQPEFLERLAVAIRPGGLLHLATDWAPYADWMLDGLATVPEFKNQGEPFVPRPAWRPDTRFERRGLDRGYQIFDLLLERR
ncbi:MAG: tRNA (guanosine(46)-N7)-methyltransferase TrmB [Wenzhouxiangella sp.]